MHLHMHRNIDSLALSSTTLLHRLEEKAGPVAKYRLTSTTKYTCILYTVHALIVHILKLCATERMHAAMPVDFSSSGAIKLSWQQFYGACDVVVDNERIRK